MRRLRNRPLIAVFVLVALLVALSAQGLRPDETPPAVALGQLEVQAPSTHPAQDAFTVLVGGVDEGQIVEVVIESSYGIRSIEAIAEARSIAVEIPPSDHAEAGLVVIDVWTETDHGSTTMRLSPGEAVGPLDVYLGPRTMFADGNDLAMVVAVPTDAQGNPVATGTRIDTRTVRPDLAVEVDATMTSGLLGYRMLLSETLAGATLVTATSGEATGPARRVDEVAGTPVDLALSSLDPAPTADGRALMRVVTNELADQYGNLVPDGTIVTLDAAGVTGVRRQTATTIAATATFVVEAPDLPGQATFTAYVSTAVSPPLVVDFGPAVADLPLQMTLPDETALVDAGLQLDIGAVTTPLGALIPDGTEAFVTIESIGSGDAFVRRAQLYSGRGTVTLTLQELDDFGGDLRLTVRVLGKQATVEWPGS